MCERASKSSSPTSANKSTVLGAGIGMIFGATMGNAGIGMVLGAAVGHWVGPALERKIDK